MRPLAVITVATAALLVPAAAAGGAQAVPVEHRCNPLQDRIELPTGWQPEGITTDGRKLYGGSLATGELFRANPRSGNVTVLPRSETGSPAVGVDFDKRRKVIWVAGANNGEIRVHAAGSGRLLRTYTMPPAAPPSDGRFVNDLVVTRNAVFATDSFNQELAVVPLQGRGLPPSGAADVLPLTGDLSYVDDTFNANGIVARGGYLVLVQSATGLLFRVDPGTGETREIDLGGYLVTNGDGLELEDDRLYVVRNRVNLIAVIDLAPDLLSGELVGELTSTDFDVPTTVALLKGSLYAVNARFGVPSPETQDYWITRVDATP